MTATGAGMAESRTWPVATDTKEVAKVDLWRPLLDAVSWFEHAKVYIISGEHPDGDMLRYEAKGGFEALAKMKSGEWCSLHAQNEIELATGERRASEPSGEWQITGWKTEEMHWIASPKRLFVEALDTALRQPQDVREAAALRALRSDREILPRGNEVTAAPLFCTDLREPEGGYRRCGYRWRWL